MFETRLPKLTLVSLGDRHRYFGSHLDDGLLPSWRFRGHGGPRPGEVVIFPFGLARFGAIFGSFNNGPVLLLTTTPALFALGRLGIPDLVPFPHLLDLYTLLPAEDDQLNQDNHDHASRGDVSEVIDEFLCETLVVIVDEEA